MKPYIIISAKPKECLHVLRRNIFICVLLLNSFISLTKSSAITDIQNTPDLISIATIFAQNIDNLKIQTDNYYHFQFIRNPYGWFVSLYSYSDTAKSTLEIWTEKSGFADLIDPLKKDREIDITEFIDIDDVYEFSIHPYYGYSHWMQDVIRDYSVKDPKQLTDHELYGLGRAYSQSASDILWSHAQFSNPESLKGQDAGRRDLREYHKLAQNAFQSFQTLAKRNPDYQTIIGKISLKAANELMARFYELKLFGFEREAKRIFRNMEGLYGGNPFWENYARLVLNSLEQDAILFTNGDNDTYPFLYLQELDNLRKDVTIINLSLLNDPLYLNLMMKNFHKNRALLPGVDTPELLCLGSEEIRVESIPQKDLDYSFADILLQLKDNNCNSSSLILPQGNYIVPFLSAEGQVDTLVLSPGKPGNIASSSGFLLQVLLHFQLSEKPIYFIKEMQEEYRQLIVSKHLVDKGLTYRIEKPQTPYLQFGEHVYDPDSLETFIRSKDDFKGNHAGNSEFMIIQLLLEAEIIMIYNAQDKEERYRRMNDFLNNYPPAETGLSHFHIYITNELYSSGGYPQTVESTSNEVLIVLEEEAEHLPNAEQTPWNIQKARYYNDLIVILEDAGFITDRPEVKERIGVLKNRIRSVLVWLPNLEIQ